MWYNYINETERTVLIMEIAQCTNVKYIQSNSMIKQGKEKDIQCYLKLGYNKTQDRNGYWVLTKPSQINITLKGLNNVVTFPARQFITSYYGKDNATYKLCEIFKNDVACGKITFEMSEDGTMFTMR